MNGKSRQWNLIAGAWIQIVLAISANVRSGPVVIQPFKRPCLVLIS